MQEIESDTYDVKDCCRCGGRAFFWETAIVPGDPLAPRGSHRSIAHYQPAWTCLSCGYIERQERRASAAEPKTASRERP